jgi:MFS superfamily sulfate permease-like transporter
MIRLRSPLRRESRRHDGIAGVVLGVESVPDGLAGGLLAGVSPMYGLYAYLVGTFTGAFVTSSSFMAVQATGRTPMRRHGPAERATLTAMIGSLIARGSRERRSEAETKRRPATRYGR